ncbi:hypothetical protein WMY93_029364 [Mugilogobius chulae]|uniref:DUF4430 domain-containing protein n=1 Tax=Mugilogobius chulae TaxID=88201 RepID=A0AAW0MS13_9GOBI
MAIHFSLSLLLLLVLCTVTFQSPHTSHTNITIVVTNSVTSGPSRTYSAYAVYRGSLFGAMKRLQQSDDFEFTYSEHPDYGPFVESVNGLAGDFSQRTYWQLKIRKPDGTIILADVGVGCYLPTFNDEIILNFTTY